MRIAVLSTALLAATGTSAQVAIGAFAGMSEDRLWQTELAHIGALGEFRSAWFPTAAVRASLSWNPERHDYREQFGLEHEPVEFQWLASVTRERMTSASAALDLKFPFENNACVGGYYKGTYVVAGLGFTQRWRTIDYWEQDRNGVVSTAHVEERTSEPAVRAGFGGEWNFSWGGPFVEGLVTISAPGQGRPMIRFPGMAMLMVGYRYSFARPETEER